MDEIDEKILKLIMGNARISYQELGNAIGMSRVAAKKRVTRLEQEGIIRGYNTCIYRPEEITLLIDIVTAPGEYETVLDYVSTRTAYVRQIYRTTRENHIHMVAVADSVRDLKYLTRMIQKDCGKSITEIHSHAVREIIKDVYGGIGYEGKSVSEGSGDHERTEGRKPPGKKGK